MEANVVWLAIVLIVILTGDALACAKPIDYIKNELGIDANCAASVTVHSNPGAWPTCPGTWR